MALSRIATLRASTGGVRVMARVLAIMGIAFGLIELPAILELAEYFPAGWYIGALIALFGLPVIVGLLSFRLFGRQLARLAAIVAISQLLIVVTWVPALRGMTIPWDSGQPWIIIACLLPTSYAALAWRGASTWLFSLLVTLMIVVLRIGSTDREIPVIASLDALRMGILFLLLNALVGVVRKAARRLDEISILTARAVSQSRHAEVLAAEQARFSALMHDGILNTLLVAGRERALIGSTITESTLSDQASEVLGQLVRFQTPGGGSIEIAGHEFIRRQRAAANGVDERVRFDSNDSGEAQVPTSVSDLFSGAIVEALRNSVRHADVPGRLVSRAVHVVHDDRGARVFVLDDGAGFDPASVDPARMGIAVSILARLRQFNGGQAEVHSTPGAGTTVALEWRRS